MSRMFSLATQSRSSPGGGPGSSCKRESRAGLAWTGLATYSQAGDAEATPLAKRVLVVAAGQWAWWPRKWVLGPDSSPLTPGPGDWTGTLRGALGTSKGGGAQTGKKFSLEKCI